MTRQRDLEFSDLMRRRCPLMHEAILQVGHRQTRNRGTIGGSLCHLDPSAELGHGRGRDGRDRDRRRGRTAQREIAFADFPVAYMTPAIEPNEMLTAVRFPLWPERHGYGFVEFSRRHGDFAIVSAAALLDRGRRRQDHARLRHARRHGRGADPRDRGREGAHRPRAGRQAAARGLRDLPQVRRDRRRARAGLLSAASCDGACRGARSRRRARGCPPPRRRTRDRSWARHARSR